MPASQAYLNGQFIRAVIFDFGEVLSYPPPPATITAMADLLHVTPEKFRERYYAERYPYDRGELSAARYWQAVARDTGTHLVPRQIEWLRQMDVAMWSNINLQMLHWAAQLRDEGIQTAVLSNMHPDMAESVRAECAWIRDFHCFVLSAELGLAKPDPQIFQRCLDCLKVQANEALFIDDKERNTQAGEELGITGICANSPATIRAQLQNAGWGGPLP